MSRRRAAPVGPWRGPSTVVRGQAGLDAGLVLDVDAGLADDVGHCQPPSLADSLRASVDLLSPPRIPCTTTPPRQGGRSGQARASGPTASCAWHCCACDIRLTDRHDVRSGHARGVRHPRQPRSVKPSSGTFHLHAKGTKRRPYRRGLPDRPEPGRRHSSPGPTITCWLSALGSRWRDQRPGPGQLLAGPRRPRDAASRNGLSRR
jgi:hypothetical protein